VHSISQRSLSHCSYPATTRGRLTLVERLLLGVAILEIPLGIDKYFLYQEDHGNLGAVAGFSVSLFSVCLAMLYGLWLWGAMRRELWPQTTIWGVPQVVYLGAVTLSILSAQVTHLAYCDLFLLSQAYLLFFYLANRLRVVGDVVFVVQCLAVGIALQGSIMIVQKALGPALYGVTHQFSVLKFIVWADGRTAGTLHSAVLAGSWLAILWLVVLPLFIAQDRRVWRWLFGCALGCGLLGMLFTQTRGAVITVGLGSVVLGVAMWLRGWLPSWTIRMAAVGALLAMVPAVSMLQNRVLQGDEGSAESRVHLTAIAMETIPRSPIFGHGAGNCHVACLPAANSGRFRSEWYFTIHCKYLIVWIETGLIGLVAFCGVLCNGIRYGVVAWWRRHPLLSPLGLGCAAAITGHAVHMFVDIFNSRPQVQTLWLVIGVAAAAARLSNRAPVSNGGGE